MKRQVFALVVCLALAGCGNGEADKTVVRIEDVPAPAMQTAKERAPEVQTFHEAYRKKDGTYEIRGKTKTGKVIEVEVKEDGTFVDIER
jgi:hypothetical protein